jgi:hypothetical protein
MTVLAKATSNSTDRPTVGKTVSTEAEDTVGIRHQATTGEDTEDWEDLVRAVVNCRVCEIEIVLYLLVVTNYLKQSERKWRQ